MEEKKYYTADEKWFCHDYDGENFTPELVKELGLIETDATILDATYKTSREKWDSPFLQLELELENGRKTTYNMVGSYDVLELLMRTNAFNPSKLEGKVIETYGNKHIVTLSVDPAKL